VTKNFVGGRESAEAQNSKAVHVGLVQLLPVHHTAIRHDITKVRATYLQNTQLNAKKHAKHVLTAKQTEQHGRDL